MYPIQRLSTLQSDSKAPSFCSLFCIKPVSVLFFALKQWSEEEHKTFYIVVYTLNSFTLEGRRFAEHGGVSNYA